MHNDWASMLAMAEYAYINSNYLSTKILPLYANYSFEPRTNWPTEIQFNNPDLELYRQYMNEAHKKRKERLEEMMGRMWKYCDKKRKIFEPFDNGELIMLNGRNI